jgi:hypothetical protein
MATEPESESFDEMPAYSAPGRLVAIVSPSTGAYRYDYDVPAYDDDSAVFWISEGEGFDYWLDQSPEIDEPGIYLFEGVTGDYIRGDGWTTDDDVDWNIRSVRKITIAEAIALDFGLSEEDFASMPLDGGC